MKCGNRARWMVQNKMAANDFNCQTLALILCANSSAFFGYFGNEITNDFPSLPSCVSLTPAPLFPCLVPSHCCLYFTFLISHAMFFVSRLTYSFFVAFLSHSFPLDVANIPGHPCVSTQLQQQPATLPHKRLVLCHLLASFLPLANCHSPLLCPDQIQAMELSLIICIKLQKLSQIPDGHKHCLATCGTILFN